MPPSMQRHYLHRSSARHGWNAFCQNCVLTIVFSTHTNKTIGCARYSPREAKTRALPPVHGRIVSMDDTLQDWTPHPDAHLSGAIVLGSAGTFSCSDPRSAIALAQSSLMHRHVHTQTHMYKQEREDTHVQR